MLTHRAPQIVLDRYAERFHIIAPSDRQEAFTKEQMEEILPACEAMFTMGAFPVQRDLLEKAPNLRAVGTFGVGLDHIDLGACTEKGIFVCNTPRTVCESTAEFSAALILSVTKGIPFFDRDARRTLSCKVDLFFDRDILFFGKTVGILGLGRIGQAVARKLQGFGVQILYYDPKRLPPEREKQLNVIYCEFEELLAAADVVTCHLPLTEKTYHLMDAAAFSKMKSTAYFVNASRGKVADETALIEALRGKRIRGAALDVFETEPQISRELTQLDNVVLTPHVASSVLEAKLNMVDEAFSGIWAVLDGRRPHNLANPELCERISLKEI